MGVVSAKTEEMFHQKFYLLQEAKKKYDKETEKYCAVLEKHLSLSAKKKESHLHEVSCFG